MSDDTYPVLAALELDNLFDRLVTDIPESLRYGSPPPPGVRVLYSLVPGQDGVYAVGIDPSVSADQLSEMFDHEGPLSDVWGASLVAECDWLSPSGVSHAAVVAAVSPAGYRFRVFGYDPAKPSLYRCWPINASALPPAMAWLRRLCPDIPVEGQ